MENRDFFNGPGEPAQPTKNGDTIPQPPPIPKTLFEPMWLDTKLETITRLQTKPGHMYTFVCAQEFRRDEFAAHSKVVHDDILGGMNNWLEHRCPMSIYGCGFSQRRIFPSSKDTLIYSPAVESFGITRRDLTKKSPEVNKKLTTGSRKSNGNTVGGNQSTSVKNLIDLPIELLLEIFNYLESFSLCNLALTSIYLRQVCCSLLDTKGCVTLQWMRVQRGRGQSSKWVIAHKRWFFSTSMGSIDQWQFSDKEAVSDHLKNCPYNVRTKHDVTTLKNWPEVLKGLQRKIEFKGQRNALK